MKEDEINKIRKYIEENTRNTNISGIPYLDFNGNKNSILAKQNTVIFGRRGSGKSTLLGEIKKEKLIYIDINLEDYKNISFPNVIIKVLECIFKNIETEITKKRFYFFDKESRKCKKEISDILKSLNNLYAEDDYYEEDVRNRIQDEVELEGSSGVKTKPLEGNVRSKIKETEENTTQRKKQFIKLEKLRKNIVDYKTKLVSACKLVYTDKPIYILLDDFYFISINNQPYLVDILHVLTKGTQIYLKLASRKQKSKLYIADNTTFQGIEIGHDATEIDLDYSLENMSNTTKFFSNLLNKIFSEVNVSIKIEDIITKDAFSQLCLASGGITRDFLIILSKCLSELIIEPGSKIGKEIVNAQAISNISSKYRSLSNDIINDNNKLEMCLESIKDEVLVNKRTNCFLIQKKELENYQLARNAIQELFDLRFIHLINKSTSCAPSDRQMYEAYILDVGLYDFIRLRDFKQIEPDYSDNRSRKDDMRSSPKISLKKLTDLLKNEEKCYV